MSTIPNTSEAGPRLQLWTPPPPGGEEPDERVVALSKNSTLTQFFRHWFLPIVLEGHKDVAEATITVYLDALRWWQALTLDPPLCQIDEYTLSKFQQGLRTATFQKGLATPHRPLAATTQHKLLRAIRAILHRVGPTVDPKRPAKGLVPATPTLVLSRPPRTPIKPTFTLPQAIKLAAAGEAMQRPQILGMSTAHFWKLLVATLFYTGLRIGAALALRWRHVIERREESWWAGWWLEVPGEVNAKTGAAIDIAIHPLLREALEEGRDGRGPDSLLLPWPHDRRFLLTLHARLQDAAGLKERQPRLSLHAWRRLHADTLNRLGMRRGLAAAQEGLGHGDEATTRESYTNLANEIRVEFPPLWTPPPADDPQRWLF